MEHRAWKSVAFDYPRSVPTMLAQEEKRYLFWLGSAWSGAGTVVEIGPWLGGSTVCLAAGMRASGRPARGKLHAIDNFLWREFMAARAPLPLVPGDSFEPFFLRNMVGYTDVVVSHARALPDETIEGDADAGATRFSGEKAVAPFDGLPGAEPVEILFIDGAKSWRGMRHLLLTLSNRLLPGKTLLVGQDFKYWGAYWVPMMMARLDARIEPVHNVLRGTTVAFRLKSAIPRGELERFKDHVASVSTDDGLRLLDRAAGWLRDDGDALGVAHVSLSCVRFLVHQGHVERAADEFLRLQSSWPSRGDASQVALAREYLASRTARELPTPLRMRLSGQRQKARGAWRKRAGPK
jgi:Methyltransferase domain